MLGVLVWIAPVASMAVVAIALALSIPLFSLLLERQGHDAVVIGLNHTVAALAMVVWAPVIPRFLARIGLVPMMVGSVLGLALSMAAIPLWPDVIWWSVLRVVFGIAATTLFFASEFWLVARAPDQYRGRVVGGYVLVLSASYMAGPLLLNALGLDGPWTYWAPTLLILSGAVPILLGRSTAPPVTEEGDARPAATLRYFLSDPMVIAGVILFGAIEYGAIGLITVWALGIGYDAEQAISFAFWMAFGSLVFQLPIGWAADRMNRRILLAGVGFVATVAPLTILLAPANGLLAAGAIFVWGGVAVALYAVALTELGGRYTGSALASATAAVVMAYGVGALVSPTLFGWAMDQIPPNGLLWASALAAGFYVSLALWRIWRTRASVLDLD